VATKIKLMRLGKIRAPYYRIVVADARNKRDGRVIETIGKYHPKEEPSFIEVNAERAAYWLGVGAQPTDPVERILKVTGDWQAFKGLPAPEPMKVKAPAVDKRVAFEAASLAGDGVAKGDATTPAKKKAPKADAAEAPKADAPAADTAAVGVPEADAPAADTAVAEVPVVETAADATPATEATEKPAEA
jgi:small subunit ribosomal protein S16